MNILTDILIQFFVMFVTNVNFIIIVIIYLEHILKIGDALCSLVGRRG